MPAYGFVHNQEPAFRCGDTVSWLTKKAGRTTVHVGIVSSKSGVNSGCWLVIEDDIPGHLVLPECDITLMGEDEVAVTRRKSRQSRQKAMPLYPSSNTLPGIAAKEKEETPRRRHRSWTSRPEEVRDIAMELFGGSYHTAKLETSE